MVQADLYGIGKSGLPYNGVISLVIVWCSRRLGTSVHVGMRDDPAKEQGQVCSPAVFAEVFKVYWFEELPQNCFSRRFAFSVW